MQLTLFDDIFGPESQSEQSVDLKEILLQRGSCFENGEKRIHEFALTKPEISKFANFLKDEYGIGGFGTPERLSNTVYRAIHDSGGIKYQAIDENGVDVEGEITWKQAAEIIIRLVNENRYL